MSAQEELILDLKRQAVALKDAGDTNGAMALLAQARDVEFQNARVEDIWEPVKLKQLAVVCKKRGDLDSAKQALLKAKQIEKDGVEAVRDHQLPEDQQQVPATTKERAQNQGTDVAVGSDEKKEDPKMDAPENQEQQMQASNNNSEQMTLGDEISGGIEDDDDDADVAEELKELMQLDANDDEDFILGDVSFTLEEMLDHDMMTEFKLGGMPVPTDEEYQAKILDCKKAALTAKKAGDTNKALQNLQKSKQLEKVRVALSQLKSEGGGDDDDDEALLRAMTSTTLNDEESELLGELMPTKPNGPPIESDLDMNDNTSGSGDLETTLEELADFLDDPGMLMDAIDMGMTVPTVEEVKAKAEEKKQTAIEHKKAGNLEGAKASLVQSKKLMAHASKLESALAQLEQKKGNGAGAKEVNMEDLEAMLEAEEKSPTTLPSSPKQQQPKPPAPTVKSSDELKQEAIKLRDAKKMKEAGEMLKQYKEALKREKQEADVKKRQKVIQVIQSEIEFAKRQARIFEFYDKFVDTDAQQATLWKNYIAKCSNVSKVIQVKGPEAVKIARKTGDLMCAKQEGQGEQEINAVAKSLIEIGSNSEVGDERLEIAIIDVQKLQENSHLEKLLKQQKRDKVPHHPTTIRIDVHLQMPPSEEEADKSIDLVFEPTEDALKKLKLTTEPEDNPQLPPSYDINKSQYVELVRGNSPYGKAVRRRIERNKKIHITAYSVPVKPKKGWFWSKKEKSDDELPPPTLIGKIVLELEGLMQNKCIAAGEFPFMNGSGSKALGGMIRLVVRTGVPFGSPGEEAATPSEEAETPAELAPYNAMSFSLDNQ